MLKCFNHRCIGIFKSSILANQSNLDFLVHIVIPVSQVPPLIERFVWVNCRLQLKTFDKEVDQTLFMKSNRNTINARNIVHTNDQFRRNMAEMRDLFLDILGYWQFTSTDDNVRGKSFPSKCFDRVLGGFCFLFSSGSRLRNQ